ncbi:grasp-with-spasm system ATP-grasp peptide maturase [marine bacterium AO1-C]|nr:grasp-with-spasm system ATP-grasp peptide maturase [marine bacterium AO1-C]
MKHTLIFSHQKELTTSHVIDFLLMANKPFVRVNGEDAVEGLHYQISDGELTLSFLINGKRVSLADIDAYWMRKRGIQVGTQLGEATVMDEHLTEVLKKEMIPLESHLHNLLEEPALVDTSVDSFSKAKYCNKLDVLYQAKKHGLSIPDTLVTTRKEAVQRFFAEHKGQVITKGINTTMALNGYATGTCVVTPQDIDELPEAFFPTLWQTQINKRYELRVFYLEQQFYATAIFSQLDTQTSVDFRNYNTNTPNRVIPFKLPPEIKEKLQRLINHLGYDSCSTDLIVDQQGDFIFLEINPVGQFGMVSEPCNYYLEKKVATILMGKHT